MGTTFSSSAFAAAPDVRHLPMSSVVSSVGALAWVAYKAATLPAAASSAAASKSGTEAPVMDPATYAPVVLVTAGW
jgi:hypothetical protein